MTRFTRLLAAAIALSVVAAAAPSSFAADAAKKADKAAARAGKKDGTAGLAGKVSSVNGSKIVVQTRGKNAAEVTIETDANTKYAGSATSLADIKPGMMIQASPGNGTATKITAQAGKGKGDRPAKGAKAAKKAAK
jgi:hypothetical protein